jgi:coenzyme F420-0:L-glutamate ligase
MKVDPISTRLFKEREDLASFVAVHVPVLKEGSIIAIASKIVALAEGRTLAPVGTKAKEALIRSESEWARKILPKWWLTVRDGTVVVNAGIDESNAQDVMILLPKDSFKSAARLRTQLQKIYKLKKLGVIITDSRITPLRAGVVGVALGYAGIAGVRDYRGTKDLHGRTMEVTQTDVADSLATAATLVMGEGAERQPLAIITDAPVKFSDRVKRDELRMDPRKDMYRGFFRTND